MTREEAIAFFKDMNECTYGNLEEVEMAIKALEQEPVLDKIMAEIENHCGLVKENHCKYCYYCNSVIGVREILEIIDKYIEREE